MLQFFIWPPNSSNTQLNIQPTTGTALEILTCFSFWFKWSNVNILFHILWCNLVKSVYFLIIRANLLRFSKSLYCVAEIQFSVHELCGNSLCFTLSCVSMSVPPCTKLSPCSVEGLCSLKLKPNQQPLDELEHQLWSRLHQHHQCWTVTELEIIFADRLNFQWRL